MFCFLAGLFGAPPTKIVTPAVISHRSHLHSRSFTPGINESSLPAPNHPPNHQGVSMNIARKIQCGLGLSLLLLCVARVGVAQTCAATWNSTSVYTAGMTASLNGINYT